MMWDDPPEKKSAPLIGVRHVGCFGKSTENDGKIQHFIAG